jgi:hypothetical protein
MIGGRAALELRKKAVGQSGSPRDHSLSGSPRADAAAHPFESVDTKELALASVERAPANESRSAAARGCLTFREPAPSAPPPAQ